MTGLQKQFLHLIPEVCTSILKTECQPANWTFFLRVDWSSSAGTMYIPSVFLAKWTWQELLKKWAVPECSSAHQSEVGAEHMTKTSTAQLPTFCGFILLREHQWKRGRLWRNNPWLKTTLDKNCSVQLQFFPLESRFLKALWQQRKEESYHSLESVQTEHRYLHMHE